MEQTNKNQQILNEENSTSPSASDAAVVLSKINKSTYSASRNAGEN